MTRQTNPPDQIFLRDHVRQLDIGAFTQERGAKQSVSFSVTVDLAPIAGAEDDVDAILSYDTILEAIDQTLATSRFDLLEALAEGIAGRILAHPLARQVNVRIEKLDRVPGRLGVEITRTGDVGKFDGGDAGPRVYCLGAGATLPTLADGPNVIAIEGQPQTLPDAEIPGRHLELLASEASAWVLASSHADIAVVATRTELRYAIAAEHTVLWAPQKLVFDAADGVDSVPRDFGQLCGWLASELAACELVFVGRDAPPDLLFSGKISKMGDQ